MRIYLASQYSRRLGMLAYHQALAAAGHTVTSRWALGLHDAPGAEAQYAAEDMEDVRAADLLILVTDAPAVSQPSRGGMWVELGLALAWEKRVWIVGPRSNLFCTLPTIQQFETVAECLEMLAVQDIQA